MENLIISVEATCDLSKELIQKHNIKVAPMEFMIDDEIFSTQKDDVVSSKLYEKMRKSAKTKTSQINQDSYEKFFESNLKNGETILHLAFSSGQSNTVFSAKSAANKINLKHGKKIYVIDTLCSCSGHGFLAILASEFAKDAKGVQEVVKFVENLKKKIKHCFTVEDLKYLYNGGRIKKSTAIIGSLLNIKPVLRVDDEGKLVQVKNVILRKKAIKCLFEEFEKSYNNNYKQCFISHADCLNDAMFLANMIKEKTDVVPTIENLGPIIGCHSGPGTLALFFVGDKR